MFDILALLAQTAPTAAAYASPWDSTKLLTREQLRQVVIEHAKRHHQSGTGLPIEGASSPTFAASALSVREAPASVARPSDMLSAMKRLRAMSKYGDNWDGEGAPAPDAAVVEAAITLVGFLSPEGLRMRASLDAEGRPLLLLSQGEEEGEVVMTSPTTFNFAWFGGLEDQGDIDVIFDGNHLPSTLRDALPKRDLAVAA